MRVDIIAGTRPNLVKVAPLINALERSGRKDVIDYRFVYTGQHYDSELSTCFFRDLNIPDPHIDLNVGSGSHAEQTAQIMIGYESAIEAQRPDLCIVVGDVNSTLACALTAKKCNVEVAHIEAGIRSGDNSMPEETNRIATDSITDWFYTTGETANINLERSGVDKNRIITVGNIMIDSLTQKIDEFRQPTSWTTHNLSNKDYLLLTLHRPENVDSAEILQQLMTAIDSGARGQKILFPVHPRTRSVLDTLEANFRNVIKLDPLPYLEFMYLLSNCSGVITDSGGLSEESTFLRIPCITLRSTTERPETVDVGTNELIGRNTDELKKKMFTISERRWKTGKIPPMWDGQTANRIVDHLFQRCVRSSQYNKTA